MFLINGYKQESLAVSDRATQFGDGCFTQSQFVIGAYPATTGCLSAVDDFRDFWPQLEQEMKRWQQNSKMVTKVDQSR